MRVAIGLCANLDDRLATLREAASRVGQVARDLERSCVGESAPVGGSPQPGSLSASVLDGWSDGPIELLDALMAIEADLGRVRSVPNAARTIDLDVLWIEATVLDE